jgi:DUF971 family protein
MSAPPKQIRALQEEGAVEIVWNDGRKYLLPIRFLRGHCPCASCVNEITGERTLDLNTIPDDIHLIKMSFTGNYALKISWSDGHNTGLFTWNYISKLCRHDEIRGERSDASAS